ncbi:MAG: alpha-glucosidase/alpha-galactosidase [Clostridiales bacterium]|nr:alpha-glucosidase/alpha-galactosidase [Clostridiales bacterium]
MIDHGKSVSDVKIAYIGGGSRGWAWTFMTDLALEPSMSGTIRLYDIDEQAAKANEIIGNAVSARAEAVGKWKYEVSRTLKDALAGVDFVVISILPGTFDEMASDVHLPERCGIYQSVGDTVGPGGLVRALRTIPMFVEIAEAIRAYAPKAWVINYTNPMSLCIRTLYHVFPQIKAFGCCHEVFGTQKVLKAIAEQALEIEDIPRQDIHVNVLGLNHFTWFDKASYRCHDLFPIYGAFIEKNYEEGYNDPDRNWANSTFNCAHRVKFDLFRRYGAIAAAGDRHLAEFMPGDTYLRSPETVKSWKFGLTTVSWRKSDLKLRLEKSAELAGGRREVELKPTGEEGILLIKALCGLGRMVSNVNIPNANGQIANMPRDCVVETNAVFSCDSIAPVFAGHVPQPVLALMHPHVENQRDTLTAALNHDFDLCLEALMRDPLVAGRITKEQGRLLLHDMMENTRRYLPGWNI